jgi:hypothetical protein
MNLMKSIKVINDEWSGSHQLSKGIEAHLFLDDLCGPLQLPLMDFLGVVGFGPSRSFQEY